MKSSSYSMKIAAPRERVWSVMLDQDTYRQWAQAFSENPQYVGEWAPRSSIDFLDPALGGSRARVEEYVPPSKVQVVHTAMIAQDGKTDTTSDMAKKWIGGTESYTLSEVDDATLVEVDMVAHPDFSQMFDDCWPRALQLLRELCEG